MVCVCPPHTSMNLNDRSPASSVMWVTNDRAAAGSRYSSTKRTIVESLPGRDARVRQGGELVDVGLAHRSQRVQRLAGFVLVNLRHREPDVDQHPVAGRQRFVLEQGH